MMRFSDVHRSGAISMALLFVLSACGGGSRGAVPPPGPASVARAVRSASATFAFTFPKPTASQARAAQSSRTPKYLSSATKSISLHVTDTKNAGSNADIYANVPAALTAVQSVDFANLTGDGSIAGQCGTDPKNALNYKCTATFQLPVGINTITIASWDAAGGTGNKLSQQIATVTTLQGVANGPGGAYTITLDGNLGTMTVSGSGACQSGPVGNAYGSVGTSAVTFTVAYTDAAGKTIPTGVVGQPKLQIQDNTSTWQSANGTINASGGTVAFSIDQSAQSYTLTPNTVPISNATINVRAIAPNSTGSSDGLTYVVANSSKSYTFSAGTAPPAHNFLAAVEQTGTNSGKVDFFNVTLDGSSEPVSLSAFSPASLAVTQSTNDNTQNDVDNPVSLAWDGTGDLLIGNGGSSGNGNMACVPVGAISTGANSSTTVTANIHVPVGLAYEPRNGTVAVGNDSNIGVAPPLAEYVLSGNYVASTTVGSSTTHSGQGAIGMSLINLGTSFPTGTFAATLWDNCEVDPNPVNYAGTHFPQSCSDPNGRQSQIVLFNASGITTTIGDTSTFHVDAPWGLTYDSSNQQLIVANTSSWHPSLAFFTTTGSFLKTDGYDYFNNSSNPYMVVANNLGSYAVVRTTAISSDQVVIYTNHSNTTAPTLVSTVEYNARAQACAGAYLYGSSAIITSMTWLSSTRLLVALQTSMTSANGLYIYDTSTTTTPPNAYDDATCSAVGAQPVQKSFQPITNKPLATAFKP